MSNSLNIHLTTELRRFIDEQAGESNTFITSSEYIRNLIRKDRSNKIVESIVQGLREIREGLAVKKTAMDIFNEE